MPIIINHNTTWTSGSIHTLTDDVQIAAGVTLTLQPGAVVIGNGHQIQTFGTLSALGSLAEHAALEDVQLTFGSDHLSPGRINLDHVDMQGGAFLPATGNASYGSFALTNSHFNGTGASYVWYPTSESVIQGNLFENAALGIGTRVNVSIFDNLFVGYSENYNGSAAIVVWATYDASSVTASGNAFLNDGFALEVAIDGTSLIASGNYFGTVDRAEIASLVLDNRDDLSRPSRIEFNPFLDSPSEATRPLLEAAALTIASLGLPFAFGTSNADTLTGTSAADSIFGYEGNDSSDGGGGADLMNGGDGNDLFNFSTVTSTSHATAIGLIDGGDGFDTVDLRWVAPASVSLSRNAADDGYIPIIQVGTQRFEMRGVERILFGASNDGIELLLVNGPLRVFGGAGNDSFGTPKANMSLYGGEGDDSFGLLRGTIGGPPDTGIIDGGAGFDTMSFNIGFVVDTLAGTATSFSTIFSISSIERFLLLPGQSAYGNETDEYFGINPIFNSPDGPAGNGGLIFDGRGGNDTLVGGFAQDSLVGGTGNDVLDGGDENDALAGGDGNDMLDGGTGNDTLRGGNGQDSLAGGSGIDWLYGNAGIDALVGGSGADKLFGGFGKDTMTGNAGADQFSFYDGETAATRSGADIITDFIQTHDDLLRLKDMDANTTLAGDQKFMFIGTGAFTGVARQLHYLHDGGNTYVEGDTDGDGLADFVIRLDGLINLINGDFVL